MIGILFVSIEVGKGIKGEKKRLDLWGTRFLIWISASPPLTSTDLQATYWLLHMPLSPCQLVFVARNVILLTCLEEAGSQEAGTVQADSVASSFSLK